MIELVPGSLAEVRKPGGTPVCAKRPDVRAFSRVMSVRDVIGHEKKVVELSKQDAAAWIAYVLDRVEFRRGDGVIGRADAEGVILDDMVPRELFELVHLLPHVGGMDEESKKN